jgi:hypothetical protein
MFSLVQTADSFLGPHDVEPPDQTFACSSLFMKVTFHIWSNGQSFWLQI